MTTRIWAWHLMMARRYDEALRQARTTLDLDPNFARARMWLAFVYEQKRQYQAAIAQLQEGAVSRQDHATATAMLAHVYAMAGKRGKAARILRELQDRSKREYVSSYDTAVIFAALGQANEAFRCLEDAYRQRDGWLALWLTVDPRLDGLRPDPRFGQLVGRLGIDQGTF